jgi:hypothetical protein
MCYHLIKGDLVNPVYKGLRVPMLYKTCRNRNEEINKERGGKEGGRKTRINKKDGRNREWAVHNKRKEDEEKQERWKKQREGSA